MRTVVFTQRVEVVESYDERRDCADQRIAGFIAACGFLPVPLPNCSGLAERYLWGLEPAGIVLTGGNSMVKYGGNAPERDTMDGELLRLAIMKRVPVYGFCRGMQSILVFFGNELVNVKDHIGIRHSVRHNQGFREVNSYHHQACVDVVLSGELRVEARTEDGVVEAISHRNLPIYGTMWHPERETPFHTEDKECLKACFNGNR